MTHSEITQLNPAFGYNYLIASDTTDFMNQNRTQQNLLLLFLLLSLLIHLLLVFLSKQVTLFPKPQKQERVYVQMREPEQFRDLDIPVRKEVQKPREKPAKRLGPADQVVEKEQAPKGDSPEDMRPDAAAPPSPAEKPSVAAPQPKKSKPEAETLPGGKQATVQKQIKATEEKQPREETGASEQSETLPDARSLLQLPSDTTARIDKEWRRKQRDDVAVGDEVWLDSEYDLLTSFFQRLRSGIYRVWNYPAEAAREGREGKSLISMTFLRDGSVQKVELLQSSGSRILDKAARAAVLKGGPYGALPRSYPNDKLTIKAWFRYDLRKSRTKGAGIFGQ